METIVDRLAVVQERVEEACARCGRSADEVGIVAVTKTFGPDVVCEAADAGLRILGENRVQEARQKIALCPGHLEWHMVGHLQSNKVAAAAQFFSMIHSVDSLKILELLEVACRKVGVRMPVCLQVNVSGEASKSGMDPEAGPLLLERSCELTAVSVVGLMTIPPFTPEAEGARPHFARLRDLRDTWSESTGVPLEELSMGMSHDYSIAIEEGATLVRLGTALFGTRSGSRGWRADTDV